MISLLGRYVEASTLKAFALVGIVLVSLFSLLQFIEQLRFVGQGNYGLIDALEYVLLTAPATLLQVTPVAALLGTLMALGALSNSSELTAMRAAGVSNARIVGWVLVLGAGVMLILALVAEFVIPRAEHFAEITRTSKISPLDTLMTDNGLWARGNQRFLNIRRFSSANDPEDLDIYGFTADGHLERFIHADHGMVRPDGTWLLSGVESKTFDDSGIATRHVDQLVWTSFLRPQQLQLLVLPPGSMAPVALYQYVHDLKRQHQQATRFETALWTLLTMPLTTLAMILIAVPIVFGSNRSQSVGQRIMIGTLIGIAFSLLQQMTSYVGLLLNANVALTAVLPPVLLLVLAAVLSRRRKA